MTSSTQNEPASFELARIEDRARNSRPESGHEVIALIAQINAWKRACGLLESKSDILLKQQEVQLATIDKLTASLANAHNLIRQQSADPFQRVEALIRKLRERADKPGENGSGLA